MAQVAPPPPPPSSSNIHSVGNEKRMEKRGKTRLESRHGELILAPPADALGYFPLLEKEEGSVEIGRAY